jgi:hypothetical protein
VVFALLVLFTARFSIRSGFNYDVGVYYLQTIQWNSEFSIVPGLANLHGRFGYNSSLYVLASLFQMPAFGWAPAFSCGPLLGALVLTTFAVRLHRFDSTKASHWFAAATLVACLLSPETALHRLGSLSTDTSAALLIFYCTYLALVVLEDGPAAPAASILIPACVFGVTLKLSALPLLVLILVGILAARVSWRLKAAAAIVGILWMARRFTLSGCLVYPVGASCLDVPWGVGAAAAREEAAYIWVWAKEHGTFGLFGELRRLSLLLIVLAATGLARKVIRRELRLAKISPSLVCGLGVCFCFLAAPDNRFAMGFFLAATFSLFSIGIETSRPISPVPEMLWQTVALALICAVPAARGWRVPDWPAFGSPVTSMEESAFGAVRVPLGSDDRCWDAPLPCTPQPIPRGSGAPALRQYLRRLFAK